jgi:hypothetical protein
LCLFLKENHQPLSVSPIASLAENLETDAVEGRSCRQGVRREEKGRLF